MPARKYVYTEFEAELSQLQAKAKALLPAANHFLVGAEMRQIIKSVDTIKGLILAPASIRKFIEDEDSEQMVNGR